MIKFVTNMLLSTPLQYFEGDPDIDTEALIKDYKTKMFNKLLDSPYMTNPVTIKFDLETPSGHDLVACVEKYKCYDGRYWIGGTSICREDLEKRLSQVKCILVMKVSDSTNYII